MNNGMKAAANKKENGSCMKNQGMEMKKKK